MDNSQIFGTEDYEKVQKMYEEMTSYEYQRKIRKLKIKNHVNEKFDEYEEDV